MLLTAARTLLLGFDEQANPWPRAEVMCETAGHRLAEHFLKADTGLVGRQPCKTQLSPPVYPWPWAVHTSSLLLVILNHHPQFCLLAVGEKKKESLEHTVTEQRQTEAIYSPVKMKTGETVQSHRDWQQIGKEGFIQPGWIHHKCLLQSVPSLRTLGARG